MDVPDYAKGTQELWTPALMRDALVHAIRVMRAMPGGAFTEQAAWVDFNDQWGYADEEKNLKVKWRPSAEDIGHMETLLIGKGRGRAWLNGAVMGYMRQRRVLIRWATWVACGCRDREGEPQTDDGFAQSIGLSEATMKRRRDFAAGIMAQQANRQGIPVWYVDLPARPRRQRENIQAAGSV